MSDLSVEIEKLVNEALFEARNDPIVVPEDAVRKVRRICFEFELSTKSAGAFMDAITLMLRGVSLKLSGIEYIRTSEKYDTGKGFDV